MRREGAVALTHGADPDQFHHGLGFAIAARA